MSNEEAGDPTDMDEAAGGLGGDSAGQVPPEPLFSPEELSLLLGEKNVPTPEQAAIISSP